MAQIKILPPEVAQKIAAGEVIERPASVVKELVENSIDAAATQITIEIRNGGMELIRVQDNGSGIARDDLRLAFEAHATSKISEVDDLFALYTLGFRGEALPSIASVSKLTLYSRPPEQKTGYKILNVNGEYQVEPVGTPPGTTVEVRDLFYNVPARLKFVKSPTAERRRVVELASRLALAHPHISFRLVVEGKTSLVTPGSGRLLDSILLVEGKNVEPQLLKLSTTTAWGRIQGYLGTPQLAKGNRSGQVFIVNGRVIENRTLRAALEKAYEGLLPKRTFPWAVLVVEIQPELVDCNVHPAKLEVRFADEQAIFNETLQAVRAGLAGRNIAPKLTKPQNASAPPRTAKPAVQAMLRWQPETWEFMDQVLRKHKPRVRGAEGGADQGREAAAGVKESAVGDYTAGSLDDVRAMLRSGRIIGQLHQTYILLETPQGLWILDQHIVHERILVDKSAGLGAVGHPGAGDPAPAPRVYPQRGAPGGRVFGAFGRVRGGTGTFRRQQLHPAGRAQLPRPQRWKLEGRDFGDRAERRENHGQQGRSPDHPGVQRCGQSRTVPGGAGDEGTCGRIGPV